MNVFSVYTMAPMMCMARHNKTRLQDIHQLQTTAVTVQDNKRWYSVSWLNDSFLGYLTTLY